MAADSWTQALFATPPLMCGRRLLPFSLSHSLLLRALRNPYAYCDLPAAQEQLLQAVDVCSRTTAENQAVMFGGRRNIPGLALWVWRWRSIDMADEDANMRIYIAKFSLRAERYDEGAVDPTTAMAAPVEYHLHRHLCEIEGMAEMQAWDCAVGRAWAYFDAYQEWRGGKELVNGYNSRLRQIEHDIARAQSEGDEARANALWEEMRGLVVVTQKGGE